MEKAKTKMSDFSEDGLNRAIFQCVDRALSRLGETSKTALYYQIATRKKIERRQLETRPLEVVEGLRDLLGVSGYAFFEKLIARELKMTFDLNLREGASVKEAVEQLKKINSSS
jgi:hypothetical protein